MKANIILRSKMFQNRKVSQIKAFPLDIYCIFQTSIIISSIITYLLILFYQKLFKIKSEFQKIFLLIKPNQH